MDSDPKLSVTLHFDGVLNGHARTAGNATKRLQVTSVQFQCDGCGLRRADRPGPDEGWTHRDGDDLCPACTARSEATT